MFMKKIINKFKKYLNLMYNKFLYLLKLLGLLKMEYIATFTVTGPHDIPPELTNGGIMTFKTTQNKDIDAINWFHDYLRTYILKTNLKGLVTLFNIDKQKLVDHTVF